MEATGGRGVEQKVSDRLACRFSEQQLVSMQTELCDVSLVQNGGGVGSSLFTSAGATNSDFRSALELFHE